MCTAAKKPSHDIACCCLAWSIVATLLCDTAAVEYSGTPKKREISVAHTYRRRIASKRASMNDSASFFTKFDVNLGVDLRWYCAVLQEIGGCEARFLRQYFVVG